MNGLEKRKLQRKSKLFITLQIIARMREDVALFLFLLVIVSVIFLFYNTASLGKEGFDNHSEFVLRQNKQFNDVGLTLGVKKNTGLLGKTANDILNTRPIDEVLQWRKKKLKNAGLPATQQ